MFTCFALSHLSSALSTEQHRSQLYCTMSSLEPGRWPLVLVLVLLLQLQSVTLQRIDVAQRLQWLNGQV